MQGSLLQVPASMQNWSLVLPFSLYEATMKPFPPTPEVLIQQGILSVRPMIIQRRIKWGSQPPYSWLGVISSSTILRSKTLHFA